MSNPLISVLMTVYNGERYLEESVGSVLRQDMEDFELVVVDDGSTDRTSVILEKLAMQDQRLRLRHQSNRGIPKSSNEGLAMCRGQYIARLDSDDVAKPDRLRRQLEYLQQHDVVGAGSSFDLIDARGRFLTVLKPPEEDAEIQRLTLAGHGAICHPTSMIRRDALDKIGGYDEHFDLATDLDLWLRLGEVGKLANIPLSLTQYRVHPDSVSEQRGQQQRAFARQACERAWKRRDSEGTFEAEDLWRPSEDRLSKHTYALQYGWWAFNSGERSTALVYGCKAVASQPWNKESWRLLVCAAIKKPG
jgi:glycosyltransferase involved in cell wall biosynthesis